MDGVDDQTGSAERRLEEALRTGDGCEVSLYLRHLQKALSASGHLAVRQLLAGIGDNAGHVHIMYIVESRVGMLDAGNDSDPGVELQLRLPVVDM